MIEYFKNKIKYIDRNNQKMLINILGNYLVKGGAMLVSILIMPAYMNYFSSNATLGMWFTVTQFLNWLMLLDFGIGAGLRNKIIEPLKNNNKKRIIELVSSTYVSTGIIVVILSVIQVSVADSIDWYSLLGLSTKDIDKSTLILMVNILSLGVIVRFFAVIISHILYAIQEAILPSLLILISNILIMLYLIIGNRFGDRNVINLAYATSIFNNLPVLIATVWVFKTKLKNLGPKIDSFSVSTAREVIGVGGILFYIQIIFMLLFNVKEIYISWFVSSSEVVEYQIYYKLIGIVGGLYALALNPVWSAVTKAMIEGNEKWIRNLYKKGIYCIGIFGLGQFLILAIMPWIVKMWLGSHAIDVSITYGIIFSVYNLTYMWMMLNYNFACGLGRINVMAIWVTIATVLNYVLTVYISQMLQSWVAVIIATAIVSAPCALAVQLDIKKFMTNKGTK